MTIPRRFIRTVPDRSEQQAEWWWRDFGELHPRWEFVTYRDPIDPRQFPLTADSWAFCSSGAQMAGLIRLEALFHHGGIYVDSDVQPLRSFAPLLDVRAFAAWEDPRVVPDAVIGAEAGHPAIAACLQAALEAIAAGPWESGPGVTTKILPGRDDVLLLPPGAFYPYHYTDKRRANADHKAQQPWCFAVHHWWGSWLTPEQHAQHNRTAPRRQAARGAVRPVERARR